MLERQIDRCNSAKTKLLLAVLESAYSLRDLGKCFGCFMIIRWWSISRLVYQRHHLQTLFYNVTRQHTCGLRSRRPFIVEISVYEE